MPITRRQAGRSALLTSGLAACVLLSACGSHSSSATAPRSRSPARAPSTPLPGDFVALRQLDPQHSASQQILIVHDGRPRVLTTIAATAMSVVGNAALSPDGKHVAFRRDGAVAIAPAGGGPAKILARVAGRKVFFVAWSPDAKTLVFAAGIDGRDDLDEIYSVPAGGGAVRRLTHNKIGDEDPSVAPDGSIYFDRGRDVAFGLWRMNADGSGQRRLTHDSDSEVQPQVSPDGTKLAFDRYKPGAYDSSDDALVVAKADGSDARVVVGNLAAGVHQDSPAWSPDGKDLLFASNRRDLRSGLWIVPASGGTPKPALLGTDPQRLDLPGTWVR